MKISDWKCNENPITLKPLKPFLRNSYIQETTNKLNMNLYQQCKILQPWVENVKCMKVRFVVQGCFTGVMLMFRWYSEVFRLCSEVVCCSTTVPECSTVLPVFRILLLPWCSTSPLVFRVPLLRVLAFLVLKYAASFLYIRLFIQVGRFWKVYFVAM